MQLAKAPVLLSPISFWEVATLVNKGRVELDRDMQQWVYDVCSEESIKLAPLTPSAAASAACLGGFHGDPADRLLYATARELRVPFVTKDRQIRDYARKSRDIEVIW
jgi:PIN domain nuclease of toxin-antitoxin system